jgi:hypothetical protein
MALAQGPLQNVVTDRLQDRRRAINRASVRISANHGERQPTRAPAAGDGGVRPKTGTAHMPLNGFLLEHHAVPLSQKPSYGGGCGLRARSSHSDGNVGPSVIKLFAGWTVPRAPQTGAVLPTAGGVVFGGGGTAGWSLRHHRKCWRCVRNALTVPDHLASGSNMWPWSRNEIATRVRSPADAGDQNPTAVGALISLRTSGHAPANRAQRPLLACLSGPRQMGPDPFVDDASGNAGSSTLHFAWTRATRIAGGAKSAQRSPPRFSLRRQRHDRRIVGERLTTSMKSFSGTARLSASKYRTLSEWMKVTRPYYRASYVFAATDAGWRSLADVPRSQAIGPTIGTGADLRLIQYLQALSHAERWSRFPMSTDEAALKALANGTIGVALVWGPALWALQRNDAAFLKVRLLSPNPLPAASADVGAAVLANESFLRNSVDQAIASLTRDGTIRAILDSDKFRPPP